MFLMLLLCTKATAQSTTNTTLEPWAEWNPTTTTLSFYYGEKPTSKDGVIIYNVENSYYPTWGNTTGSADADIVGKITHVVFNPSFKDARPTSCFNWFASPELKSIEGIEYLNTENVTNFAYMFAGARSLSSIDVSHFNTAKASRMDNMFGGCSSLTELDLRSFETGQIIGDDDYKQGLNEMFQSCANLKIIYASDKFNTAKCIYSENMFNGCTSLEGAVKYDASKTDKTMANYSTGYFCAGYYFANNTKHPITGSSLTVDNLTLADGSDFAASMPFTAQTAVYKRNMSNIWGTLCLPYTFSADAGDATFYEVSSLSDKELVIKQIEGDVEAGTPVIVRRGESAQSIEVDAHNTSVTTAPQAASMLVGTFTQEDVPADCYIIKNDKFWLVSSLTSKENVNAVKTAGLRAYVKNSGTQAAQSVLGIVRNGEETAIGTLNAADNGSATCYDIQGRRTNGLQKGINIVKTGNTVKKIIIK